MAEAETEGVQGLDILDQEERAQAEGQEFPKVDTTQAFPGEEPGAPKRGKPPESEDGARDIQMTFYVNEPEKKLIDALVSYCGGSRASLLRRMVMGNALILWVKEKIDEITGAAAA